MPAEDRGSMRRVAISSQKGGVAKTTTCLSLGAALAERGKSVLLVDLDPQAHLTRALGVNPEQVRRSVGDVLLKQSTLLQVSRESAWSNLDLVPADRGLILVEKVLYGSKGYEFRLRASLEALQGRYYEIVLFDCPPSFGPLTLNALSASNLVIIPVTCEPFAAQSLQAFMKLLEMLRSNANPLIDHRLLVTMYDNRTRLARLIYDQYRQKYSAKMFETKIPLDNKLRESSVFSRPITQYAANARSAQEYRSLAEELMRCLNVTS